MSFSSSSWPPLDNGFLPSPETIYSSDDDFIITPSKEHAGRDLFSRDFDFDSSFPSPNGVPPQCHAADFGLEAMDDYFAAPSTSQLFATSSIESTKHTSVQSHFPPIVSPPAEVLNTKGITNSIDSEVNAFDAAFAAANEERATHAPFLVQTSFTEACRHSSRFPAGHLLNQSFARIYELGDELGSGGYGFVMTAYNRMEGSEVAVKFIIKDKVSEHAWTEDEVFGKLPMEVMLLSIIDHDNIVKCLDLFADGLYFYLVQELHGSPWKKMQQVLPPKSSLSLAESCSPPFLSPSASEESIMDFEPITPLQSLNHLDMIPRAAQIRETEPSLYHIPDSRSATCDTPFQKQRFASFPQFTRRPSHDLFECIEQTPNKRLSEDQARYIFAQVVEAAYYLDSQGITHRDIKDENLVIDENLKVKLIDFGSAVIADPAEPRPFYNLFFGTTAYASSEILQKKSYQAPPAEVWTLGVLLSYLLTGMSPFPTEKDAIDGRIILVQIPGVTLSRTSMNLMRRCLEPNPDRRADIKEVRAHRWLTQPPLS